EPGALLVAGTTLLLSLGVATGIGALSVLRFARQLVAWFGLLLKDGVVFSGRGASFLGRPIAGAFRRGEQGNEDEEDGPFTLDDEDVRPVRRARAAKAETIAKEEPPRKVKEKEL